jgi:ABC-type multidrug transport system fused ATPase/permease subunit
MEKIEISKSIFTKKTKDYSFVVLFLVIFSVFIVFAIRPSLSAAFSLRKEEIDLEKINSIYENSIKDITLIQSQVEENRDNLPLLNQAISEYPQVNKIIEDVKKIADKDSITIKKANIADVKLSKNNKQLENVRFIIEGKTTFDNLLLFTQDLFSQRRLKMVNNIVLSVDPISTESGQLKLILTIDAYYL